MNRTHLINRDKADAKSRTNESRRSKRAVSEVDTAAETNEEAFVRIKQMRVPIYEMGSRSFALLGLSFLLAIQFPAFSGDAENFPNIEFPQDPQILNVKDFGAKGDGVSDDTGPVKKAFAAIDKHFKMIYFPNGTYLVSDTFGWRNFAIMQGQNRNKTTIRLKDSSPGYGDIKKLKPVIRCLYNNNESIGNYMSDFTVEIGKGNPGAIGIRYNCHNWGTCERVAIRAAEDSGAIGLDLSETEFGPAMIRDIRIDGFATGIKTPGQPSNAVLERIVLQHQRVVGFENRFPVSIRKLSSVNTVPAILNAGGCLTQLVLLDSSLTGGSPDNFGIVNEKGCSLYLRDVSTSGYRAALQENGVAVPGTALALHITGEKRSNAGAEPVALRLPVEDPPEILREPPDQWKIVDDKEDDDTQAIQSAIDSGAKTICFKSNGKYRISDTIHIRGAVRRIVGIMETNIGAKYEDFTNNKPFVRFDGTGSEPVVWENVGVGAWPHYVHAIELATTQTVYLKGFQSVAGCVITNTEKAKGKLFIDEFFNHLRLDFPQQVWIRQCNTENNPFNCKQPKCPTYITNTGGTVWILGLKTESPAINIFTTKGGHSEVLGGFFRDHFSPAEYGKEWPYFRTEDGELSATYTQYAWAPGKARGLQATEDAGTNAREVRVDKGNFVMALYSK